MRLSRMALLLLAGAAALQLFYYYPRTPETLASHFDGSGTPNGHQTRDAFFAFSAAMIVVSLAISLGLGALFRLLPSKMFNLPNRDYWLAPERREESLEFMSAQMEWYGAASLLLFLFVIQMVLETNLGPAPELDSNAIWVVLALYLGFNVVWVTRFILRFRKIPASA